MKGFLLAQADTTADTPAATEQIVTDPAAVSIFENFSLEKILQWAVETLPQYGLRLLLALAILFIGGKVANFLAKMIQKALDTAGVDPSLGKFLTSIARLLLKVMVFIFAANALGVPIATFVALLGAAGLAVGLALKDGLGNFAGGVILLLFKPFKVGDWIETGDHFGRVKAIHMFYTEMETKSVTHVSIPNGVLANGDIVNHSKTPLFRVQALVGIGYEDDIRKAREIMLAQCAKDERIVSDPEPFVVVKELGDSSVNLELRAWCPAEKSRRVLFELLENIKIGFDDAGISIPYPQQDVHMFDSQGKAA